MAVTALATAPDGALEYARSSDIVKLGAPFAWSEVVQARVVRLRNGDQILILDTSANVQAVLGALNGGASVQPAADTPNPTGGADGQ